MQDQANNSQAFATVDCPGCFVQFAPAEMAKHLCRKCPHLMRRMCQPASDGLAMWSLVKLRQSEVRHNFVQCCIDVDSFTT